MTVGDSVVMDFIYGSSGEPYAVKYNGTVYYYVLNLQGDVVKLFSSTGTSYGTYKYDAWGNILYQTNNDLMNYNPLRYRGYVYDAETQFYYLGSRYYDPEIGRFVNADGYLSTGQGILGNNMFAYCNNDPVNLLDPTGTLCWANFGDNRLYNTNMLTDFGGGSSYANGGISTRGSYISIKDYLDTNDPEVVFDNLEKYNMAYYNGVPVFQANFGNGGGLSFGFIVIDDSYSYDNGGSTVLNHEYGHRLHMDEIGIISYTFTAAIPSFLHATLYNVGIVKNYYSLPWEYIADMYGGVNRGPEYTPWAASVAKEYWLYTKVFSMLTGGT